LLIVLAGFTWLYNFQGKRIQSEVENELTAIARLKEAQISSWRVNQLAEADELSGRIFFTENVARWLSTRQPGVALSILNDFRALQQHYHYSDVLLTDIHGQVLLSLSGILNSDHEIVSPIIAAAIGDRKSKLSDLHTCKLNPKPHIILVAPLFIGNGHTRSPIGTVLLVSEAQKFLNPILAMWPKPSLSAETLLVRRDGDNVLFLSDLRFRPGAALSLRIPLSRTEVLAVMAVLNTKGVLYGKDYRGIEVVSVLLPIENSPWFVVAKVDRTEAFASGNLTSALILVVILGLAVLSGAGDLISWQLNEKAHYKALRDSEAAQRKNEQRFIIAAEILGDVIFEWDLGEKIEWFGNIDELLGYSQGDFPGSLQGWVEALHPDDRERVMDALIRHVNESLPYDIEYRIRKINGDYAYWTSRGRLVLDSAGKKTSWIGVVSDITERKQAENSLKKLNEELEHSNRELDQFAYVVSHDLQEPLRTITSYTQLLAKRYEGRLDQDAQDFIHYAVDGASRMQRLIRDLLSYARITTNTNPFVSVNMNDVFGEATANLHAAIAESAAEITKGDLPTVNGDYRQMVQIFQNLIGNGIKFHKTDAPPRVYISSARSDGEWVISVKDNGIGIDPQYFNRIFTIFQRLHGKQEYPGNGIGLALCKRIVERHGGRIWVESAPAEGAAFCFSIRA
jgi:PAS domain S-box-containing protein